MPDYRICGFLGLAAAALASLVRADDLAGTVTASSDYRFRGIDRTDGPALQGEVDYLATNGFYAGASAANARSVGGGEIDAYTGYGRTIIVRGLYPVHFDAGLVGYLFPGDERDADSRHNIDSFESYAGFRLGPASLKAYLSPDYANASGVAAALRGALHWPLLERLNLRVEGGINLGPGLRNYTARLTKDGRGRSYFDYAVLFEYSLPADFVVGAGFAGTTLNIADGHGRDGAQPKLRLEVSKRFSF